MFEFFAKLLPDGFVTRFGKSKSDWSSEEHGTPVVEDADWSSLRLHPLSSSFGAARQKRPPAKQEHKWGYRGQENFLEHKRTYQNLRKFGED